MEVSRLKTFMRNNARLQSLGLPTLSTLFANKAVISPEKRKPEHTCDESEAEYHPNEEDTSEGDSSDDSLIDEREVLQDLKSTPSPSSKLKGLNDCKKTSEETNKKRSTAMAPGGIKPRPPKRIHVELPTNARVTRSNKRLLLDADASPQSEGVSDPKHQTPIAIHGDRAHSDDDYWMSNGSDLIARHDDGNHMDFEAGGPQSYEETRERGVNIGEGLERISRRRGGKLPLVIPEGRLRPETPLLAAKFATECNVTVRGHVPVFKRWKDYKDPGGNVREGIFQNFVGKVGNKFEMDVKAVPVRKACTQMLKANTCLLHLMGDKYKEKEPTTLDLFKECHYSNKKKGYTDAVQAAIDEMEEKATQPTEDGEQSNSATKAVAEVLTKHTKKPMFLKHVGVQHVHERSSRSDREAEQEAQKRGNAELQALVETLNNKLQESEEARIRQEEERTKQEEENRKKQAELEAKLDILLNQIHPR
ncbi:hypothetical protein CFC21_044775 [Triticum aestivum]|nr:hypothetical protein CFC21_044775 [Triticum aestivum]